jgi:hypothetical protein
MGLRLVYWAMDVACAVHLSPVKSADEGLKNRIIDWQSGTLRQAGVTTSVNPSNQ